MLNNREEAGGSTGGRADTRSMAEDLVDLRYRIDHGEDGYRPFTEAGLHCDVLIIGSGYGGAVSAAALAETLSSADGGQRRIWLLERGQHYLPGEFPNQLAELPSHVRFNTHQSLNTKGQRKGLFDVRVSDDVSVLVGNGLGGGSLINAGVMAWPVDEVFRQAPWPRQIADELAALRGLADTMSQRLGARTHDDGQDNTILRQTSDLAKFKALQRMSQASTATTSQFTPTPITVAMRDTDRSSDNVRLKACTLCGDCATGCNEGAKISLDTSLLASAKRRGVKLITGATVLRLSRLRDQPGEEDAQEGWIAHVNHTDPSLQWRQGRPLQLRARRIIVAAGTLGSTGILLRSASDTLSFSSQLGERFSANGDLVMAAYRQTQDAVAVASEAIAPDQRRVGPTITAMIDRRSAGVGEPHRALPLGHVIQDLAVPAALERLFSELHTTANTVHQLGRTDQSDHGGLTEHDPCSVNARDIRRTLPLAIIGHDTAQGRIQQVKPSRERDEKVSGMTHLESDSAITVSWPELRLDPRFDTQLDMLKDLLKARDTGGTLLPNPAWKPVPKNMEFLVDGQRGPLFTAHPLGGCAMGSSIRDGVVNHLGQVFCPDADPSAIHDGLVVLDGSIIPTSLGINPSLTISVLTDRAIRTLIKDWGFGETRPDRGLHRDRPTVAAPALPAPQPTCIEITEQLRGWFGRFGVQITLRFQEIEVQQLLHGQPAMRTLKVDPAHSEVKVIVPNEGEPCDWQSPSTVVLHARLNGSLRALHRANTCAPERIAKAGGAWFLNRGLRDITQYALHKLSGLQSPDIHYPSLGERACNAIALASRGGEIRMLEYDLGIEQVAVHSGPWADPHRLHTNRIRGCKYVSYTRRGNPWDQLMTLTLKSFPGLDLGCPDRPATLKLNLAHLADLGVPLLRITRQRDMPSALMDIISLALLFLRILISIHVWTMRAPDLAPQRKVNRLPGTVPGLPPPEITHLDMGEPPLADGTPVRVRLTRYPPHTPKGRAHPLVMLHGYSASGTTFAHHSVQPGLAKYMWDLGHDVWLVDMRTSAGMPTATCAWTFEDTAYRDIPLALCHVADVCGVAQVDVFAHCMGSAMLWLALLTEIEALESDIDRRGTGVSAQGALLATRHLVALARLQGRLADGQSGPSLIRRLGMSQIAPIVRFSEGNLLRAFMMRYLRHYLPLGPYRFRPDPEDSDTNQVLDQIMQRLLATIPYPEEEFSIENPLCPPWKTAPWARTRRRMDALYGRDFDIGNLDQRMLDHIDDHFGPLSLDTLEQALHLARNQAVSDQHGINMVTTISLARAIDSLEAMMSIHGINNGLSDIHGLHAFKRQVHELKRGHKYTVHAIPDRGHQDCLIGREASTRVFPHVAAFFNL